MHAQRGVSLSRTDEERKHVTEAEHVLTLPLSQESITVVALAASAGGLSALSKVLSALPAHFPAAIVIVQHLDRQHPSHMAEILRRRTALPVKQAAEGDPLQPGAVAIAPPDQHLLVKPDGTLALSHAELVHFLRPSADLLFESVAASYKKRALAVVLTGMGTRRRQGRKSDQENGRHRHRPGQDDGPILRDADGRH